MKKKHSFERKRYKDKENPLYPPIKESIVGNIFLSIAIMVTCIVLAVIIIN